MPTPKIFEFRSARTERHGIVDVVQINANGIFIELVVLALTQKFNSCNIGVRNLQRDPCVSHHSLQATVAENQVRSPKHTECNDGHTDDWK